MDAQFWGYMKSHWILHFKWEFFIICQLCLKKVVFKKMKNRSSFRHTARKFWGFPEAFAAEAARGGGGVWSRPGKAAVTSQLGENSLMPCGDPLPSPNPIHSWVRRENWPRKVARPRLHSPPRNSSRLKPEAVTPRLLPEKQSLKGSRRNHLCWGQKRTREGSYGHLDWGHWPRQHCFPQMASSGNF